MPSAEGEGEVEGAAAVVTAGTGPVLPGHPPAADIENTVQVAVLEDMVVLKVPL